MAVFVPVSFMGGITGRMFRQFALCIASSIGLSTLVALTLAPALCSMILKSGEEKADFKFIQMFDDWFASVRDKYLVYTKSFVESPKLTFGVLGIIVLFTVGMFMLIPRGFYLRKIEGQFLLKFSYQMVHQPPEQIQLQQMSNQNF